MRVCEGEGKGGGSCCDASASFVVVDTPLFLLLLCSYVLCIPINNTCALCYLATDAASPATAVATTVTAAAAAPTAGSADSTDTVSAGAADSASGTGATGASSLAELSKAPWTGDRLRMLEAPPSDHAYGVTAASRPGKGFLKALRRDTALLASSLPEGIVVHAYEVRDQAVPCCCLIVNS